VEGVRTKSLGYISSARFDMDKAPPMGRDDGQNRVHRVVILVVRRIDTAIWGTWNFMLGTIAVSHTYRCIARHPTDLP
jgi:hypothetical protein